MGLRAFAVAFAAASAHGEPKVALEYRAPGLCPDRAQFVAKMADRGGRLEGADSAERVQKLEVSVEQSSESAFVGTLLVTATDGSSTSREIHDPDCVEVVTGLAVVAAIALGGREGSEPQSPALAEPQEAPRSVEAPSAPVKPKAPEPHLRGSSFGPPSSIEVSAGTLRFERDQRLTLRGGIDYGLIPHLLMPRFDLDLSASEFAVTPSGSSRLVGPIVQVRWTMYGPASRTEGGRNTEALGFGASVASCSAFTYDDRGLSLLACGEFGLGSLAVETTEADGSSSKKHTGFGLAGLTFDTKYSLGKLLHVGLQLGGRMQLGAIDANEVGGQQDSDVPLFWGGYATAGIGVHF